MLAAFRQQIHELAERQLAKFDDGAQAGQAGGCGFGVQLEHHSAQE
jgi:hypothetical protein